MPQWRLVHLSTASQAPSDGPTAAPSTWIHLHPLDHASSLRGLLASLRVPEPATRIRELPGEQLPRPFRARNLGHAHQEKPQAVAGPRGVTSLHNLSGPAGGRLVGISLSPCLHSWGAYLHSGRPGHLGGAGPAHGGEGRPAPWQAGSRCTGHSAQGTWHLFCWDQLRATLRDSLGAAPSQNYGGSLQTDLRQVQALRAAIPVSQTNRLEFSPG